MADMSGTATAWREFSGLDPLEVCPRAGVSFNDILQVYSVSSFGQDIYISLTRQEVFSDSPQGQSLIAIKDYFFDLSVLWYLAGAKNIPLSGNLINPANVPGGQIFIKGTHVLPLGDIARKYNRHRDLFLEAGHRYGGVEDNYGDVSVKLSPFPRLPVYIILWFGDEDFPPRGQLLLDSTCSLHLSTDVLWAVTMVCCLLLLHE